MIWLAVALVALGLLVMLAGLHFWTDKRQRWPSRLFNTGAGIFALALVFWIIVAVWSLVDAGAMYGA